MPRRTLVPLLVTLGVLNLAMLVYDLLFDHRRFILLPIMAVPACFLVALHVYREDRARRDATRLDR